jgi:dUTP pyrophosphatase
MNQLDPKILEEIQNQFEKIKLSENFSPDEDYQKELESLLNLTFTDEFEKDLTDSMMTHNLNVKKLHEDAVIPSYNYEGDSGFDLYSVEEVIIPALGRALVPTGISVSFNEGMELQVRPKSGLAINQGLTVLNSPGTVDFGYSGEIKVIIFNTNQTTVTIKKGMKIAQGVLCPVLCGKFVNIQEVYELGETDRGNNGFGSTGLI